MRQKLAVQLAACGAIASSLVAPAAPGPAASPPPQREDARERGRERRAGAELATVVDENIDTVAVTEPSALAFDGAGKTLFIVGDGGDIGAIDVVGEDRLARERVRGDIEGAAFDADTNRLYVVDERLATIIEVDSARLEVSRRLRIDREFNGSEVLANSNDGVEGLALVPGVGKGEPDRWFICRQGSEDDPAQRPPALIELEQRETQDDSEPALTIARIIEFPDARDFAALHYDAANQRIVIVSDAEDALYFYDLKSCEARRAVGLPGRNQEGFEVDGEGAWYIAQDSGGVIKAQPRADLGTVWDAAMKVEAIEHSAGAASKPGGANTTTGGGSLPRWTVAA